MNLLITGASGFLGRFVVREAIRCGHHVRAQIRPTSNMSDIEWVDHDLVELVRTDLRAKPLSEELLQGIEGVIHLAAAKTGDFFEQFGSTVVATENLLDAMVQAKVERMIAISSFSVYDYLKISCARTLDEQSPVYDDLSRCGDDYAKTKTLQERLVRDQADKHDLKVTILRPGVIFGPDNLWTARLGFELGRKQWVRTGANARLPLTYVENCAEAIVLAVACDEAVGQTLNVVDDDLPTQRQYAVALRKCQTPRPHIFPINWTLMRCVARCGWLVNRVFFGLRIRVPAIFRPAALHARCKPLRFSNDAIKKCLNWQPRKTWREAVQQNSD